MDGGKKVAWKCLRRKTIKIRVLKFTKVKGRIKESVKTGNFTFKRTRIIREG